MSGAWADRVRAALGLEEVGNDGPRIVADVDAKDWHEAVRLCRDDLGCDFFDWLSAIDEGPGDKIGDKASARTGDKASADVSVDSGDGGSARTDPKAGDEPVESDGAENGDVIVANPAFTIIAHLWNIAERRGVLLRAGLAEGAVASVTDLYPGADWHERETHEMFGVDFPGHPDLKPLLLAPEFEGHPLRKDFVLAARVVKPWPGAKEPGEGHSTARKRAPKRPPGVPEDWIRPGEPGSDAPAPGGADAA